MKKYREIDIKINVLIETLEVLTSLKFNLN